MNLIMNYLLILTVCDIKHDFEIIAAENTFLNFMQARVMLFLSSKELIYLLTAYISICQKKNSNPDAFFLICLFRVRCRLLLSERCRCKGYHRKF